MTFDWAYIACGVALVIVVLSRVRFFSAVNKAAYPCSKQLNASAIADELIKNSSIENVTVESAKIIAMGKYLPSDRKLVLSEKIGKATTVAAVTLAGYEAGRVIQYERNYVPLKMKKTVAPVINLLSWAGLFSVAVALVLQHAVLIHWSCLVFAASVLLSLLLLAPENDTSYLISLIYKQRAYFDTKEYAHAKKVFGARVFLLPVLRICNPKSL